MKSKKSLRKKISKKYKPPQNDRLSKAFDALKLIPPEYRGSDRFLDVVAWNLRYFNDKDPARVERITKILNVLNADIMVFEEIMDGSLQVVEEGLRKSGAGYYKTAYGNTGGDQRIAIMYDVEWVRAKGDIHELFSKGQVVAKNGKDAFPRLPLYAYFTCLVQNVSKPPFDFQLLGVHLKSQRGEGGDSGAIQREASARQLVNWLKRDAPKVDADVIIIGDWNEPPDAQAWKPIKQFENEGGVLFNALNDTGKISHLMYKTKSDFGSRLDLAAVSVAASYEMKDKPNVVRWKSLDDLLKKNPGSAEIQTYIREISANLSDHMPIIVRFYFTEDGNG